MNTRLTSTLTALTVALAFTAPTVAIAMPKFSCHKKLRPKKVVIGKRGYYEVKKGLSTSKRSGFVERKKLKVKRGCFLGSLQSDQCVVMYFDRKAFKKHRGSSARVQCVLSDDPSKVIKSSQQGALGRSMKAISGYEFLLFAPNKTGYASSTGHNSQRSRALEDANKKKNLIMKSFCVPRALTRFSKSIGKKIYCQRYDSKTDTVLFATEFTFLGPVKR
jgi:hypothetical protein